MPWRTDPSRSVAWRRIGASQPNVSQHLAVLRTAGLQGAERDGREVRYRLADPDVMVACGVMRSVLERSADVAGRMAEQSASFRCRQPRVM